MTLNKYQRDMLRKYRRWLNNTPFTKEVAAFEYMKRNPYFISIVYGCECDSQHYRQLLQQVFLYTSFDILANGSLEYGTLKRTKEEHFKEYDGMMAEYYYTGEHYYYSKIYTEDIDQYDSDVEEGFIKLSKSALNAKKENPIDMSMYYKNGTNLRWLEHLLPSLYIKINPYIKQEDLKLALGTLIKQIDKGTAIANTIMSPYVKTNSKFLFIPTIMLPQVTHF